MKLEELASSVSQKIERLQNADAQDVARAEASFQQANSALRTKIDELKEALISLELLSGAIQYPVPSIEKLPTNALVSQPSVKATVNTESEASAKGANVQIPTSAAGLFA
nr:unnamed protein product [Spirometra erinaceieuropaei]